LEQRGNPDLWGTRLTIDFWWLNIFGIASHDHFYMISRILLIFIVLFFSDSERIRFAFKRAGEAEEQNV